MRAWPAWFTLTQILRKPTESLGETFGSFDGTIARGYSRIEDVPHDGHGIHVEWAHAAGGMISTAVDLITFYVALASDRLFDDAGTYEQMCQLVGYNESYGQGVEIIDDPDIGLYYGHRGNFVGTRSILAYFPEERMTLVVCHTYLDFSMSHPADLMKRIVHGIRGDAPAVQDDLGLEGPEILAETSNLVVNGDAPTRGKCDLALRQAWSLDTLGGHPLKMVGDIHVHDDGSLCLLDRGSARITVLNSDGDLMRSFGGHRDGPQFEYPVRLFITPSYVHVLDFGRNGDKIKTYEKSGNYVKTSDLEKGVSPRLFIDDDRYLAVRTGQDVLNRPTHELLEIETLDRETGSVLAKFPAEDKLILETMVPMGRHILLEDDINIFPRLIVHFDGDSLYLGRSDRYMIKKIDLNGGEQLAFSITGRDREKLPQGYAVSLAGRTTAAGKPITGDTKRRFIAQFPERQAFYTKITTDEQGLIYVFVPDITDFGTQQIDIFSPEGTYLYHAVVELPDGSERVRPLELEGEHLYALVEGEEGKTELINFEIQRPEPP